MRSLLPGSGDGGSADLGTRRGLRCRVGCGLVASMARESPHRNRVKHYHQPGDIHELTFSCYRRLPLLTNHQWRRWLAESIDDAVKIHDFHLNAFVFMPEHVHLLIWPTSSNTTAQDISTFLAAVKRPVSRRVRAALSDSAAGKGAQRLRERLTIRDEAAKRGGQAGGRPSGPGISGGLSAHPSAEMPGPVVRFVTTTGQPAVS